MTETTMTETRSSATTIAPAAVTAADALEQVRSIRSLRPALAANGLQDDRDKCDTARNMALLAAAGASRLMVPAQYGGLWQGSLFGGWGALIRAEAEIGAGDGPTCQNDAGGRAPFREGRPAGAEDRAEEAYVTTAEMLRAEGEARGKAEDILVVFEQRGINVDDRSRERIESCMKVGTLNGWFRRAFKVDQASDLFEE